MKHPPDASIEPVLMPAKPSVPMQRVGVVDGPGDGQLGGAQWHDLLATVGVSSRRCASSSWSAAVETVLASKPDGSV